VTTLETTTTSVLGACTICGIAVRAADTGSRPVAIPLPFPTADPATGYRCGDCAPLTSNVAVWRAAAESRFPGWGRAAPWRAARAKDLPRCRSFIETHFDLETKSPSPDRFPHVRDSEIRDVRLMLERRAWPQVPQPPADPAAHVLTSSALLEWPTATPCWTCGVPVEPGDGVVVTGPDPTRAWSTPDPLEQTTTADVQLRYKDRQAAPSVGGPAWRQCPDCTTATPADQAERITGRTLDDIREPWAARALAAMPIPRYAAVAPRQTGDGLPAPFEHADRAWWHDELQRQLDQHRPARPHRSPDGRPCQVCGCHTSMVWTWIATAPLCETCHDAFVPHVPENASTLSGEFAVDSETRRPYTTKPGQWRQTWQAAIVPDSPAWGRMDPADQYAQMQRYAEQTLCDADLVAAYAAGYRGPLLYRLAEKTGFVLAIEHGDYGPHVDWPDEPFGYCDVDEHRRRVSDVARQQS